MSSYKKRMLKTTAIYFIGQMSTRVLSILLLVPGALSGMFDFWPLFFVAIGREGFNGFLLLAELLLVLLVGALASFFQLYLAMAIGHLFGKNRIALSVVAYIAIQTVLNTLITVPLAVVGEWAGEHINYFLADTFENNAWAVVHGGLWLLILGTAVIGAVFFFGTEYILRKKLNLE